MKTKINLTNKLAKGSVLVIFAISVMINISAQNAQNVVRSEKYASNEYMASENAVDNTKKLMSEGSSTSTNADAMLESFLLKAAGINPIVKMAESETNDAIENNENIGFENFLITAAGINQVVNCDVNDNNSDAGKDLENFLLHAASIDSMQNSITLPIDLNNESQDAGLDEFLLRAAGLGSYTCSNMD